MRPLGVRPVARIAIWAGDATKVSRRGINQADDGAAELFVGGDGERVGGNHVAALRFAAPAQAAEHEAIGAGVLELERHLFARHDGHLVAAVLAALAFPLVDDELVVDPDADAAADLSVEAVIFGVAWLDHAGPADRALGAHGRVGRVVGVKVEVDVGIEANEVERGQLAVGEVLGLESKMVGLEDALERRAAVGTGGVQSNRLRRRGILSGWRQIEIVGWDELRGVEGDAHESDAEASFWPL